ncbi:hypothetical protein [Pararhizobium gei]|uniref:hypothetical protein n=1 Tax=Pararhizobium gei TaxID=1395951 RepID=UPI0023DA3C53|nr:hypothetical protein [Rhizobium gei]
MKLATILLPLALGLAMPATAGQANKSAYTDFNTDKCRTVAQDDEGGGIVMTCAGWKENAVHFMEGDMRQSFLYGPVSSAFLDGTFESFEPFNHTGSKIEWRLGGDGKPVATILRWFIENLDPATSQPSPKMRGQVLVVSRVAAGDGKSCVVGYVDALANPEPNILARQIADTIATGFRCSIDDAGFHGMRGPLAAEPTHVFPET